MVMSSLGVGVHRTFSGVAVEVELEVEVEVEVEVSFLPSSGTSDIFVLERVARATGAGTGWVVGSKMSVGSVAFSKSVSSVDSSRSAGCGCFSSFRVDVSSFTLSLKVATRDVTYDLVFGS